MHRDHNMRQLVAFIGGLDLCDGRFDTSEHSLFHTLKTVHSEDYHQACYPGASIKQGGVCGYLSISGAMYVRCNTTSKPQKCYIAAESVNEHQPQDVTFDRHSRCCSNLS